MQNEDIVAPLRNELIDLSYRQEEILAELTKLVNDTDKNEKVLAALENCFKALENLEEVYRQAFIEMEKAAYGKLAEALKV